MLPIAIISAVAQIAPIVTKWLDAGKSVQEVADKAGNIAKILTGLPDEASALAEIAQEPAYIAEFQQRLLEQDLVYEQIFAADKADARKRDVALASTPAGNVRANWLTVVAVATIWGCLMVIIFLTDLGQFAQGIIMMILGMYVKELSNIYAFEFGATRKLREKTILSDKDL